MAILKKVADHNPQGTILEPFGLTKKEWDENGEKVAKMLEEWASMSTVTEKYEAMYKHIGKNSKDFELMLLRFLLILDQFHINTSVHGSEDRE